MSSEQLKQHSDIETLPPPVRFLATSATGIRLPDGRMADVQQNTDVLTAYFAKIAPVHRRFRQLVVPIVYTDAGWISRLFYAGRGSYFHVDETDPYVWMNTDKIFTTAQQMGEDIGAYFSFGIAYEFVKQCAALSLFIDKTKFRQVENRRLSQGIASIAGSLLLQAGVGLAEAIKNEEEAPKFNRRQIIKYAIIGGAGGIGGSVFYTTQLDGLTLAQREATAHVATIYSLSHAFPVNIY